MGGGGSLTLLVVRRARVQLSVKAVIVRFTIVAGVRTVAVNMAPAVVRRGLVVTVPLKMGFRTTVPTGEQVTRLPQRLLRHFMLVTLMMLVIAVRWGSSGRGELFVRPFCCGTAFRSSKESREPAVQEVLFGSLSWAAWCVWPPLLPPLLQLLLTILTQMLLRVVAHRPSTQPLWLHLAESCW